MGGISDLFNGSIQKNWANDAGLSARLVIPLLVVTGLIYLSSKVISFLRLVLSLFVLPGKSVRPTIFVYEIIISDEIFVTLDILIWSATVMGTRHRRLGRHWERICSSARASALFDFADLAHGL